VLECLRRHISKVNPSAIFILILSKKMTVNITRPGLGVSLAISIAIGVLMSPTVSSIKDSDAQMSAPDYGTESSLQSDLQVQCIHAPVFPQANQPITIIAGLVDKSLAPKVADSIEIVIDTNITETVIPNKAINNSSRLNYTIGPFPNLTTLSYGCHATDNSTSTSLFTGFKKIVIGGFNETSRASRAIPVLYTGNRSTNLDMLFIADSKSFSSSTDPNFLKDVESAIAIYYNQSILLQNQNKTNFWIAQDMGQVKDNCEPIPPANWNSEYVSFEAAVILHRQDSIRDCTMPSTQLSTANMATVAKEGYLLLHEIGHQTFGEADEYDNPGFFISSYPYQNVFNTIQDCESYIDDTLAFEKVCRKIPYRDSLEYFTADTKLNDVMVDNKQMQDLDKRRIQEWFENCLAPLDSIPAPPPDCKGELRR
jgi:hypothetical protein